MDYLKYEELNDLTIIPKVPIMIKSNIRNFRRLTQNLPDVYSLDFYDLVSQGVLYSISYVQDAIFGLYNEDEAIFVLRNDLSQNEPWYNNDIQKITSIVSSLLTVGFYNSMAVMGNKLNLIGDIVFSTKAFALPNIDETIKYLEFKQNFFVENAINNAIFFELEFKMDKQKLAEILKKPSDEKQDILYKYTGIKFDTHYPSDYYLGIGIYKVKTFIPTKDGNTSTRNRWHVDHQVPRFLQDKTFLKNILMEDLIKT